LSFIPVEYCVTLLSRVKKREIKTTPNVVGVTLLRFATVYCVW
jgi:hypothetical protein